MSIFEIRSFLGLVGYYKSFENGLKLSIRGRIVGLRPDHRERDQGCSEHLGCGCW